MRKDYAATGLLMRLLHASVWLLIFFVAWAVFRRIMSPTEALVRGTLNTGMMMALFYGAGWLYRRYYERQHWVAFGSGVVLLMVAITMLRHYANLQFPDLSSSSTYNIGHPNVSFWGVLFTNVLTLLNSLLYEAVRSGIALQQRHTALESERREAKLLFLRTQMNPHFLFNTLNDVYSLAVAKSDKTAPMVLGLSGLLRYVVYDAQQDRVTLQGEVAMLESYIALFQMQHESPQHIRFTHTLPQAPVLIEPLLLMPIVENCFKHCDFAENPNAFAAFELVADEHTLTFHAQNSYNPRQQQKDAVGGVGLENIRRRLSLQYADSHTLTITTTDGVFALHLKLEHHGSE